MMTIDRRAVLRGFGMAGAAALVPACAQEQQAATSSKFFERIGKPIGLQLYALVGQDPVADPAALFAQVAGMGYGEIELPNLLGQEPAALKAAADAAGITLSSLHVPAVPFVPSDGLTFQAEPDEVAAAANALGIDYLVIPFPVLPGDFAIGEGEGFPEAISRTFAGSGLDHWRATADRFNAIGRAMKDRGITVAYHNHNLEFVPLEGTTPWAVLMDGTDPELVQVQLDLGWVAQAGIDPLAELRRLAPRVTSLHVKDLTLADGTSYYFGMNPTELGNGVMDWKAILSAAEEAGVVHYFVEQEPPFAIPREEAMQKNADFLLGLEA